MEVEKMEVVYYLHVLYTYTLIFYLLRYYDATLLDLDFQGVVIIHDLLILSIPPTLIQTTNAGNV